MSLDKEKARAGSQALADRLILYIMMGSIVGARLGHVFFYDWPRYSGHWIDIFKVWEGGLASHGGTIGAILALAFFRWQIGKQYPALSFLVLLDLICIPTAVTACFIRIGNFVNQEILGTVTDMPWAVVFGHPADGSFPMSRHPVQLYEAAAYLATFAFLFTLWRFKGKSLPAGFISGLFFILVFGSRLILENYKEPQSLLIDESYWMMGQYLSVPFILMGTLLLTYSWCRQIRPNAC
jgi:prolipoprotein diacylglyceryl transferase